MLNQRRFCPTTSTSGAEHSRQVAGVGLQTLPRVEHAHTSDAGCPRRGPRRTPEVLTQQQQPLTAARPAHDAHQACTHSSNHSPLPSLTDAAATTHHCPSYPRRAPDTPQQQPLTAALLDQTPGRAPPCPQQSGAAGSRPGPARRCSGPARFRGRPVGIGAQATQKVNRLVEG